jgi:hypothetical protein
MSLKQTYVNLVHSLRPAAERVSLLSTLERHSDQSRWARWSRSLFAIHDSQAMIALDLPWWNLDAIDRVHDFLAKRDAPAVFEFGSGASTTWLARRCDTVVSVEHDAPWAEQVLRQTAALDNVSIEICPPETDLADDGKAVESGKGGVAGDFRRYVDAIARQDQLFDLIVIDGRCRAEALKRAAPFLKPDGMIVFDNALRRRYQEAIATTGLDIEKHYGLCACLPYPDATWLLRRGISANGE